VYDGRVFRSPENGGQASGRSVQNDPITFTQRFDGNRLVQVITSESGSRRSEFTLSADGQTLTMRVTLTSGSLPRALQYALTFRRH
jgi:hypothetical protein